MAFHAGASPQHSSTSDLNLPNTITVGRIFLVPLLVVVLLTKFEGRLILGVRKELVGAAIFGLASLTDWLDGYLARRRQQVTTLGQFMDPLADKLLITAALVSLVQMDLAQSWIVVVILGREIAVTVLRSMAQSRGVAIPASPLGKFKMASQVTAILLLILGGSTCRSSCCWQDRALDRDDHGGRLGVRLLPPFQPRPVVIAISPRIAELPECSIHELSEFQFGDSSSSTPAILQFHR